MSGSNMVMSLVMMGVMAAVGDYALFKAQGQMLGMAWGGNPSETYLENLTARLTATRTPEDESILAEFLPAAPDGWARAPYVNADGEALTGRELKDNVLGGYLGGDHATVLLRSLVDNPKNIAQKVETYTKGDRTVIVQIVYRPPGWSYDMATKVMETLMSSEFVASNSDLPVYGSLRGVALRMEGQEDKDGNILPFRHFLADLGTDVDLEVVTNLPDNDLRAFLAKIDVVGLARLAGLPDAEANATLPILWDAEAKAVEGLSSREQIAARQSNMNSWLQGFTPSDEPTEAEGASLLDLAKPAQGTCVRRAGALVCP